MIGQIDVYIVDGGKESYVISTDWIANETIFPHRRICYLICNVNSLRLYTMEAGTSIETGYLSILGDTGASSAALKI